MRLNRDEVSKAVHAGLVLLGPDSDVAVPAKIAEGLYHLKVMLKAIGEGQYALVPAMHEGPPKGPPKPPNMKKIENNDD